MTAPDLDPQLSASMRRTILRYTIKNPGAVWSARRLATALGSIALVSGVAAAAVVIIVAGLPGFGSTPPVASTPTTTAIPMPTPTPTATPTASPTLAPPVATEPTPTTPAADPTDPSDPSTWIIGFDGVGPVRLGSSLEEQRQQLPAFSDITDPLCVGGYLSLEAPSGFSFLFVGAQDQQTMTAAITFGNGGAALADDRATTPKTAEGVGIDSTKDELFAAYPGIELTGMYQSEDYPYYGITDGAGGWIVFALINDEVSTIQIANEAALPNENRSVKTMPSERCPA